MIKVERSPCSCERDLVITIPAEDIDGLVEELNLVVHYYTRHITPYKGTPVVWGLAGELDRWQERERR